MCFWRNLSSNPHGGTQPSSWRVFAMALVGFLILVLLMLGSVLLLKIAPLLAQIAGLLGLMLFIYMITILIAFLRYVYWVRRMVRRFRKNPPENTKEVREARRIAKRKADAEANAEVNDIMFKWAVKQLGLPRIDKSESE
jgi:membrane protein implicated in regulation of membrane protease activity